MKNFKERNIFEHEAYVIRHPYFRQFVYNHYPYKYTQGPAQVLNESIAKESGLNCIAFAFLSMKHIRGITPPTDDPVQMYYDNSNSRIIESEDELHIGDVFFVGRSGISEFRVIPNEIKGDSRAVREFCRQYPGLHLAVYTGQKDRFNSPLLIHSTVVDGKVSVWPKSKFDQYERYNVTYLM